MKSCAPVATAVEQLKANKQQRQQLRRLWGMVVMGEGVRIFPTADMGLTLLASEPLKMRHRHFNIFLRLLLGQIVKCSDLICIININYTITVP